MSKLPFVCRNVEPESDTDDEIDNTAEIQLEEALKFYQNALKLHAQGPPSFDATQAAYDDLFNSEIFTYPEALSFSKRQDGLQIESSAGGDDDSDGETVDNPDEDFIATAQDSTDGVPSTLPQIIYLSLKNYAQFQLDLLCYNLKKAGVAGSCIDDIGRELKEETLRVAKKCLITLCDAVDLDGSDSEVWRQMSRLSLLLGSPRMARFCLEAALQRGTKDGSDDSLERELAYEDLVTLRAGLQDGLQGLKTCDNGLSVSLSIRKALDPCPGLPKPSIHHDGSDFSARHCVVLQLKEQTWYSLGSAILETRQRYSKNGNTFDDMCVGYRIESTSIHPSKLDVKLENRPIGTQCPDDCRTITSEKATDGTEANDSKGIKSPTVIQSPEVCSPVSEQKLAMRPMSVDSSKVEATTETISDNYERKNERVGSRKRSPEAAGMSQDPPESRSRSKRLRAREAPTEEDSISRDLRQQIEKQTKQLSDADAHLFHVCHTLLQQMSINSFGTFGDFKQIPLESTSIKETRPDSLSPAMADFKKALKTWNANRSMLLNQGTGAGATATLISKGTDAGLASFMEHAKTGQKKNHELISLLKEQNVDDFIALINQDWLGIDEIALSYISVMLKSNASSADVSKSLFLDYRWTKQMRDLFYELVTIQDSHIYKELSEALLFRDEGTYNMEQAEQRSLNTSELIQLIQSLFEIHLDEFSSMIKPTSKIDQPTRTLQKARLHRWSMLASQAIRNLDQSPEEKALDSISLRHLFSMILFMSLDDSNNRDKIINGLHEVKSILQESGAATIRLPNLDIMPEISVEAVEQEISRLTTNDFFMSVFSPSDDDPVIIIESLEPILAPGSRVLAGEANGKDLVENQNDDNSLTIAKSQNKQLQDFLVKSTASLRLSLWNRLSMAYASIEYPPMVFVCSVQSIMLILSEIQSGAYLVQPEETRHANLLVWLRNIVDLVDRCINLTASEATALDGLDEENLHVALVAISHCTKFFHHFALWDDAIRLNQTSTPIQQAGAASAYKQAMALLRDMQVKTWRLLYILLRDAAKQNPNEFPDSDDDFLALLAAIHSAIGLREYCRLNKKSFLKFLKPEILALEPADLNEWRYQMAQLCYDLYDLRVLADSNTWMTLQEHNCTQDQLDRTTAREILPMVMAQIHAMKLKDITKPDRREFKQAIDEIEELIGTPKANSTSLFNRRQLNHFQKAPLKTDDLEACLRGDGGFVNMPVKNEYTWIAKTGWFFVVGYLRLASFRSVKRQGPDSTKELDEAATYLRVDIDYDSEKWETWYRLAQVYDSMLDEEVAWTTDRINNKMDDLIGLQRQAIHCYRMAVALSFKHADDLSGPHGAEPEELAGTVSELYSDFGLRLYAASRPPFNMQAFSVKDHGRWYYTPLGNKFKAQPFTPTRDAQVWLIASVLFRQALVERPNDWLNWYMIGKCFWKLLHHQDAGGISMHSVLEAFSKACETAPAKDPRRDGSPTLEPHQKLLSTIHKLVYSQGLSSVGSSEEKTYLDLREGYRYLCRSSYSKKLEFKEPCGRTEWLAVVRGFIKNLRAADKTNWHHRIVARAAELAYNDDQDEDPAKAALLQLDTIITKNMALTVWRPAFERVGRHFVYTTRYAKLIIDLLQQAGERGKLEMLGKRIRKKQAEFINHPKIWSQICKTHISLVRTQEKIPEQHEERILSTLPFETFVYNAALLQTWAQPSNDTPPEHSLLPVLRELFELKKLNLNLIPNQGIDDLIGDTYAKIYEEKVPGLVNAATNEKNREAMRVDRILMVETPLEEKSETNEVDSVPLTNPSGRAKIVGRMEVRKRAEALVQRLTQAQPLGLQHQNNSVDNQEDEIADDANGPAARRNFGAIEDADNESDLSELADDVTGEDGQELTGGHGEDDEEREEDEEQEDDEDIQDDEGAEEEREEDEERKDDEHEEAEKEEDKSAESAVVKKVNSHKT